MPELQKKQFIRGQVPKSWLVPMDVELEYKET